MALLEIRNCLQKTVYCIQEWGSLSSADKKVLQMRTCTVFGAKKLGFIEIYIVSARTRKVSQFGYFSDKGGGERVGLFLAILCGLLLWTAP